MQVPTKYIHTLYVIIQRYFIAIKYLWSDVNYPRLGSAKAFPPPSLLPFLLF